MADVKYKCKGQAALPEERWVARGAWWQQPSLQAACIDHAVQVSNTSKAKSEGMRLRVEMIWSQIKLHAQLSQQLGYDFENAAGVISSAQSTGHASAERARRYWCRRDIANFAKHGSRSHDFSRLSGSMLLPLETWSLGL